jgi:hypothetical protein
MIKNIKIRIQRNTNTSQLIQKRLFELGAQWLSGREVAEVRGAFLYVNASGIITFGNDAEKFKARKYREVTLAELDICEESVKVYNT